MGASDSDGKVTPEEVAAAAAFLKSSLRENSVEELISNLAKDRGKSQFSLDFLLLHFILSTSLLRGFSISLFRWENFSGRHCEVRAFKGRK